MAGSGGLTLSAPCLTWPVPKQNGVIPNPSEVSPSCLLLSLDLSRIMRMVEFAYGVFCGQGRKTRWTRKNFLVLCLPVSQAALRDGVGMERTLAWERSGVRTQPSLCVRIMS